MKFNSLKPSKEFNDKTKGRFLAAFDAHYGTRPAAHPSSRFTVIFKYSVVACLVLIGTVAGASVYADSANVPADSAFYSLKRASEAVQLAVTPAAAKPELQATLAVRRVNEISDLETRKPTSTIIAKLNTDLDTDVDTSVNGIVKQMKGRGVSADLCGNLLTSIAGVSSSIHGALLSNPSVIKRFEDRCRTVQKQDDNGDGDATSTTPVVVSTTTASTTASTTVSSTFHGGGFPGFGGGKDGGGHGGHHADQDGTATTTSSTVSSTVSTTIDLDL